jgi:hypothetical protein
VILEKWLSDNFLFSFSKSEKQETKNASYKNRIEILLKQQDLIETKIKSEQLQLKELDAQIRKVEDQVNELRSSHMNDDKYLIKVQEQNREVSFARLIFRSGHLFIGLFFTSFG